MDSKLPQLDPELKEAYDRVLNGQNVSSSQNPIPTAQQNQINTATPQPSPVFQPQQPQQTPIQPEPIGPQTVSAPLGSLANPVMPAQPLQQPQSIAPSEIHTPIQLTQTPPMPQPTMATPQSQPTQTLPPVQNIGGSIAYNAAGSTATVVKKSGKSLTHVLLGLGAVVFLVAYTFMWIFIFKIKLPFLPA